MMSDKFKKEIVWVEDQHFSAADTFELNLALVIEENKMDPYEVIKQRIIQKYAK